MKQSSGRAASPGGRARDLPATRPQVVDESSSNELLSAAVRRLLEGIGPVELAGVATLRSEAGGIVGELRVSADAAPRCAEELKVMVENAGRAFAKSRLATHLPRSLNRWRVVQESGDGRIQLWPVD